MLQVVPNRESSGLFHTEMATSHSYVNPNEVSFDLLVSIRDTELERLLGRLEWV